MADFEAEQPGKTVKIRNIRDSDQNTPFLTLATRRTTDYVVTQIRVPIYPSVRTVHLDTLQFCTWEEGREGRGGGREGEGGGGAGKGADEEGRGGKKG